MQANYKRKLLKLKFLIKPFVAVGVFFVVLFVFIRFFFPFYKFLKKENISPSLIFSLLVNKNLPIKTYQGRSNIVLLGLAGGNHEGSDLTDTIIFLSLDPVKKDLFILSIPRDLWIPSLVTKINAAYHYGEKKRQGGGLILAKSSVEEVVGQPIHYALAIDFSDFKTLIDMVGGVEINIEKSFTDNKYPIAGKEDDFCGGDPKFACRYETVHFESGWQVMDGEKALKYVRSRQAEGEEGNDFARDRRQQQILIALKNKIINYPYWKDLNRFRSLLDFLNNSLETDMNLSEKISLIRVFLNLTNQDIKKEVLDSGNKEKNQKGFLVNPPLDEYNGLWVLVPRVKNFEEIHSFVKCQLFESPCTMKP